MLPPIFNPERVRLTTATLLNLRDHADLDQSVECCGLLGGHREGELVRVVQAEPMINTRQSAVRFEADAADMFRVLRHFRELGLQWVGTYHSHPDAAPRPSRIDVERRQCGGMIDFIMGRAPGEIPRPTMSGNRSWFLQAWDLGGDEPRLLQMLFDDRTDAVDMADLSLHST